LRVACLFPVFWNVRRTIGLTSFPVIPTQLITPRLAV
jgi:hypothetical protein